MLNNVIYNHVTTMLGDFSATTPGPNAPYEVIAAIRGLFISHLSITRKSVPSLDVDCPDTLIMSGGAGATGRKGAKIGPLK
jgi:hypothetical protein